MQTVLITAFEPFNQEPINPTEQILGDLPDFLYNARVIKVTLPVVYRHAFDTLLPYIEKHQPDVIMLLGLAGKRTHVCFERVAINVMDATIEDNLGNLMTNQPITPGGEDGLFSTFPLQEIIKRTHAKDLPTEISNTAGTYVCNNLMYQTLHYVKDKKLETKVGFVHVPFTTEQVVSKPSIPSLARSTMVDAIMTALDTMVNPIEGGI